MAIILDIGRRLQAAGFFVPQLIETVQPVPNFVPYAGPAKIYLQNAMTFEDMELKHGSNVLTFGNSMLSKSGSLGTIFAPPPMLTWSKSVNTEVTVIDGTAAEVVERFGDGQWDITLSGVLVDMEEHHFPLEKLREIREFFEIPDAKEVSSEILNKGLGVLSIWFKSFNGNGIQGYEDTVRYSISARSIDPVEFFLNDEA